MKNQSKLNVLSQEQMSKVLGGGPIITEDMTGCKKPKPTTCS